MEPFKGVSVQAIYVKFLEQQFMVYNVESFGRIDHNVKRPLSIASSHSSVILIRMVSQERLALKPDWHLYSKSCLVRKAMKCLRTCFSRIFEMTGRTDIGL